MSFKKEFDKWKKESGQHGARAYPRFVMIMFTSELGSISNKYVFKGGNLLWYYIQTPRSTVDIDFGSKIKLRPEDLRADFDSINIPGIKFSILNIESKDDEEGVGAKVTVSYKGDDGSDGQFSIDVVFDPKIDTSKIKIMKKEIHAASMENIICDKLSACHDFAGGNTRMKDYDDLFRIVSGESDKYDRVKVGGMLEARKIESKLPYRYISEKMQEDWARYLNKQYGTRNDLPVDLREVFEFINNRLI